MGLFGKSAQQKRIDELAFEVGSLEEVLAAERGRSREKGRLAAELLSERDAARIERDTAQRERDGYRAELQKYKRGLSLGTQASVERRRFDKECREQVADRKAGRGVFAPTH